MRYRRLRDGVRERERVRRHVQRPGLGVARRARPARASGYAGHQNRGLLQRRGREQRTVVVLFQNGQRLLAQLRREVDYVVLRYSLPVEGSGPGRKGLRRGRSLAGHRRLGNGSLFDGPDRLACHTVKDVAEALLAHLRNGLDRPSVYTDVDQVGCRGEVVVPHPVVDHLKVPDALAGPRIQAYQTVSKEAIAGTLAPEVIVRGRAEGQIDVA